MLQQTQLRCTRSSSKPFTAVAAFQKPCLVRSSFVQRSQQVVRAAAVEAEPEFDYKTRQYDPKELSSAEQDPEMLNLPKGYHWYETMLLLRGTLGDEERDKELAKFEAFLNKEQCMHINALVRNRSRLAYPMKGSQWEGIYVLYTYAAKRTTARAVQQLLANPEAGSEDVLMRFITFCKY